MRNKFWADPHPFTVWVAVGLFILGLVFTLTRGQIHAQQPPQVWELHKWDYLRSPHEPMGTHVFKMQDGPCSIYIVRSDGWREGDTVAIATGQGCK